MFAQLYVTLKQFLDQTICSAYMHQISEFMYAHEKHIINMHVFLN